MALYTKGLTMHKPYTTTHPTPARRGPRLLLAWAIALLALCCFVPAASTHAQSPTWQERSTQYFDILYTPGNEAYAEAYAGFVDGIYEDISTTFDHRTETPLTIHLYPSFETYHEVNPTAKDMPGVVAHADFRRRMLAVVLPQTQQQTPEEIQNNIRHELTHIVAAELSNNRLNTGFQEGIAQYNELPSPELERKKNLLARSLENNGLMDWSSFDNRENIYGYPEQGYPQTLATVAFLIETYGFDKFRAFLINSGASSGYRSALEATYGIPASELESQWKAWLPTYIDGTSAQNAAAGYDLSYPRRLLDAGRYGEARAELEQTVEWLRSTPQEDLLAEAEKLLIRSRAGEKAEELATEARSALVAADYESASSLVAEARDAYAAIGDTRREQVLAVYAARIDRAQHANQQLAEAADLARTFRLPEARSSADAAAAEFASLGDTARVQEARELRDSVDGMQRVAALALVTLGIIGVIMSLWGRWTLREQELW
jgi:hypothetical protein